MPTMLQSRPSKRAQAPAPRPNERMRLIILVTLVAVISAAAATMVARLTDRDPAPEQLSANMPATADAADAAAAAPGAAVASGQQAPAAQAPAAAGKPGSAAPAQPEGPAPEDPIQASTLEELTPEDLAQLPPNVRKRIQANNRERTGAPPPRPKRKAGSDAVAPAQPETPDFGPPQHAGPHQIAVPDEQTSATHVTITSATTEAPTAFIVVHRLTDNGLGAVLGVQEISAGTASNVRLKLSEPLNGPADLVVSLYSDDAEPGVYRDGHDRPLRSDSGRPVFERITVAP